MRKYWNFGRKNSRRAWHVIPAQGVNEFIHIGCRLERNEGQERGRREETSGFIKSSRIGWRVRERERERDVRVRGVRCFNIEGPGRAEPSTHAPGPVSLTYRSRRNPLYTQLLVVTGNAHTNEASDALQCTRRRTYASQRDLRVPCPRENCPPGHRSSTVSQAYAPEQRWQWHGRIRACSTRFRTFEFPTKRSANSAQALPKRTVVIQKSNSCTASNEIRSQTWLKNRYDVPLFGITDEERTRCFNYFVQCLRTWTSEGCE